jgi:hypothetical protein
MNYLDGGRQDGPVSLGEKVSRNYFLAVLGMLHTIACIPDEFQERQHAYKKLREWIALSVALRYELCESLEPLSPCMVSVKNAHNAKQRLQTVVSFLDKIFGPGGNLADRWEGDCPTFL